MGLSMTQLMWASMGINALGAFSQMQHQRAAAQAQANMARMEAEAAIANAEKVRESAEAALTDQQEETRLLGEQKKSDDARRADRESAELVALAAERGQLGTTTFLRQTQQLYYFNELDAARMDRDVKKRVESLQADKQQVVENQKRTYNNASLAMYSANVNQKLATAAANRQAFFQVVGGSVQIGTQYYQNKSMQQIAANIKTS
tara:strand:- start:1586 stop:2200 length:615 start_codon:yes stop_codon:yes gene_type:complete